MEDLMRISLEDLKKYYQTYYHPANAFLVAVGNFTRGEMLARIEKTFAAFLRARPRNRKSPKTPRRQGSAGFP